MEDTINWRKFGADLLVEANEALVRFNEKEGEIKASIGEGHLKKTNRKRTATTCSLVVMLDGEFISINAGDTKFTTIWYNLSKIIQSLTCKGMLSLSQCRDLWMVNGFLTQESCTKSIGVKQHLLSVYNKDY